MSYYNLCGGIGSQHSNISKGWGVHTFYKKSLALTLTRCP